MSSSRAEFSLFKQISPQIGSLRVLWFITLTVFFYLLYIVIYPTLFKFQLSVENVVIVLTPPFKILEFIDEVSRSTHQYVGHNDTGCPKKQKRLFQIFFGILFVNLILEV